jgi:serine/threonine-protein kinase HipA
MSRRRQLSDALISNTDNHPRNHALIAAANQWELSPAYDLTPNPLTSAEKRDLAMTCGTFNRYADRHNLVSQHGQFKPSLAHATAIVDRLQQVVASRWRATLRQQGATQADCDKVASAFDYPGFELDPAMVLGGRPPGQRSASTAAVIGSSQPMGENLAQAPQDRIRKTFA